MKPPRIFIDDPESSTVRGEVYNMGEVNPDIFASEEESIASLEKLLSKRKVLSTIELEEENITPQIIAKTIAK
jgi:hypothetical protein